MTSDKVCLLAPKAGIIPPVMTVLMSFQREVWMMTAITYIIIISIYYVGTALGTQRPGPTGCNLGLEIYRVLIGAPTNRIFAQSCQRLLTSFCLIFTLVILNAFQVILIIFLYLLLCFFSVQILKKINQFFLIMCVLKSWKNFLFLFQLANTRFLLVINHAICIYCMVTLLTNFQGSLVTFLSTPLHYPDINTFADLQDSDLPIRTSSSIFRELLIGDPNLRSLASRVERWSKEVDIHNFDGHFVGFQRVNVFNLAHFKDVIYAANKTNTRVLHTMNECLISYFISYVIHRLYQN